MMATSGLVACCLDRLDPRAGLSHDVEFGARFQDMTQSLPHERMIVGEQDTGGHQAFTF